MHKRPEQTEIGGVILKPTIVFIQHDGTLDLSKEELKKLLEDAYNKGFVDGYSAATPVSSTTAWPSNITTSTNHAECACSAADPPQRREEESNVRIINGEIFVSDGNGNWRPF